MKSVKTRFRAYQLQQSGSLMSYVAGDHFTLIEARIGPISQPHIEEELELAGKMKIDTLHITSWDNDHCKLNDLIHILNNYYPSRIEYPGYPPHCNHAQDCLNEILKYKRRKAAATVVKVDPNYIDSLNTVDDSQFYKDIYYHPKVMYSSSNDNSLVKMFRKGCFNVLSMGDVEHQNISSCIRRSQKACKEVDILILAHHGANCYTNSKNFLSHIKPKVAICTSPYGSQHAHPRQEVRDSLYDLEIPIYTTKTGDIIIESTGAHQGSFKLTNYNGGGVSNVSSTKIFESKKKAILSMNADTRRNYY